MTQVIEVEGLAKRYGSTVAVEEISFAVEKAEIFGMVGPNGAGKTTTIECVEGLRRPDGGTIRTLGLDPAARPRELHERIGIQLQESTLSSRLKVWEALDLFASFYRRAVDWRALLDQLALTDKRDACFDQLSGGQKQRLAIALALLNDPEIVFLDELTTGLDPHARRAMWELVRDVRERGKTVFLTTHFMEEAEHLCDRVAIVESGRIVALDSPEALVRELGGANRVRLEVMGNPDLESVRGLAGVTSARRAGAVVEIEGTAAGLASRAVQLLAGQGVEVVDLTTRAATLEDVYLARTGRPLDAPDGEAVGR